MDENDNQEPFDRLAALHQDRFSKAHHEALDDVHKHYIETSHLFRLGEKAMLMHIHVRDRMSKNFAGVLGVKIEDKPGRAFKVKLDGAPHGIPAKAEFKCKKLNARLLTANIRTESVKRFEKGLPELKPEQRPHIQQALADWREPETTGGIEPGHGVAGYIIDTLWLKFERLCVTYFMGARKARLAVEIPLDGANSPVIELPLADITEVTTRKRVKPRVRKTDAPKADEKPKKHLKLAADDSKSTEEKPKKRARNNGDDS